MKLVGAILIVVALTAVGLWAFTESPLTHEEIASIQIAWNPPQLHETRGVIMPIIAFLQTPSGISIDTQIPIWGVLLVIIAVASAFAGLQMKMASHEKADEQRFSTQDQRFSAQEDMLKEMRNDIKELIGRNTSKGSK